MPELYFEEIKQEFDKAAEQYQKVTTKTPANATAQFNLGNALYKTNKKDEAIIDICKLSNEIAEKLGLNE